MSTIKELIEESWQTAEDKGWHSLKKRPAEDIALMHSELSEVLEELRRHDPNFVYFKLDKKGNQKPEGCPIELADVLIRIGDFCKTHAIDLDEALRLKATYNKTRDYLHGGKKL